MVSLERNSACTQAWTQMHALNSQFPTSKIKFEANRKT